MWHSELPQGWTIERRFSCIRLYTYPASAYCGPREPEKRHGLHVYGLSLMPKSPCRMCRTDGSDYHSSLVSSSLAGDDQSAERARKSSECPSRLQSPPSQLVFCLIELGMRLVSATTRMSNGISEMGSLHKPDGHAGPDCLQFCGFSGISLATPQLRESACKCRWNLKHWCWC